jgi:hypothetical protein
LATIDASVALPDFQRIAPQVFAVQLDEVERVEKYALVSVVVPDEIEKATPLSSQVTASPSMMQERERRRANGSTISGKRRVRSRQRGFPADTLLT